MEQDIKKAIIYATTIQKLYNKIKFFHYTGNILEAKIMQKDLQFIIQLEEKFYQTLINKDLAKYITYLKRKNPFMFNLTNLIFGEDSFKPHLRVYYHLKNLEESRNYYNEFCLKQLDEEKVHQYLKDKIIIRNLYFMTYYAAINNYNNSSFAIKNLRYILAFLFPEIENDFWQQEPVMMYIPGDNEYVFGECIDIFVQDMINKFSVNNLENYFTKLLKVNPNNFLEKKYLHEFYIRFLFFIMQDESLKNDYQFIVSQYVSIIPQYREIWENCLKDIQEDTLYIESFKHTFHK